MGFCGVGRWVWIGGRREERGERGFFEGFYGIV